MNTFRTKMREQSKIPASTIPRSPQIPHSRNREPAAEAEMPLPGPSAAHFSLANLAIDPPKQARPTAPARGIAVNDDSGLEQEAEVMGAHASRMRGIDHALPNPVMQRRESQGPQSHHTHLPDGLKAGLQTLSGLSMDDVRVHYHSPRPDQVEALAYTQGTDIYVGPGQEQYLAHEAWHVVQQKQRRVPTSRRLQGSAPNEREQPEGAASAMGTSAHDVGSGTSAAGSEAPIQGVFKIKAGPLKGTYATIKATDPVIKYMEGLAFKFGRGWMGAVRDMGKGTTPRETFGSTKAFIEHILEQYPEPEPKKDKRPGFSTQTYKLAQQGERVKAGTTEDDDYTLSGADEALPHRFPFADLRKSFAKFPGEDDADDLERWTGRFTEATQKKKEENLGSKHASLLDSDYEDRVDGQIEKAKKSVKRLIKLEKDGEDVDEARRDALKIFNGLHGIVPDHGPHTKINIPVSDRLHLNIDTESGRLSPSSRAAVMSSPKRMSKGVAVTGDEEHLVLTTGLVFPIKKLSSPDRDLLEDVPLAPTKLDAEDLPTLELPKKKRKKKDKNEPKKKVKK